MRYMVYDIETIPNPEVPWEPPKDKPDAFPPIMCHKVVSIGQMLLDTSGEILMFENASQYNPIESHIVSAFLTDVIGGVSNRNFTLVGYNSRNFDWPVMIARAMRYGFPIRASFAKNFRYRFSNEGHYDLADDMSDYGASPKSSLLNACLNIGLPGKVGVDGGDVKKLYADGQLSKLDDYCLADVLQTGILLARWLYIKGELTGEVYDNLVNNAFCAAQRKGANSIVAKVVEKSNMNILFRPISTIDTTEELAY